MSSTPGPETSVTQRRNNMDLLEITPEDGASASSPVTEGAIPKPTQLAAGPKPAASTVAVNWRAIKCARCMPSLRQPVSLKFHALLCTSAAFIVSISVTAASNDSSLFPACSTPNQTKKDCPEELSKISPFGTRFAAFLEIFVILRVFGDLAQGRSRFKHLLFYRRLLRIYCWRIAHPTLVLLTAAGVELTIGAEIFTCCKRETIFASVLHVVATQLLLSAAILLRLNQVVMPMTNVTLCKRHFTSATAHAQDMNHPNRPSSPISAV